MKPKDLINVPFPKCYDDCEVIKLLGVSECENIKCCDAKFKDDKEIDGIYEEGIRDED